MINCRYCEKGKLLVDVNEAFLVCTSCGAVNEEKFISVINGNELRDRYHFTNKPYSRRAYFKQNLFNFTRANHFTVNNALSLMMKFNSFFIDHYAHYRKKIIPIKYLIIRVFQLLKKEDQVLEKCKVSLSVLEKSDGFWFHFCKESECPYFKVDTIESFLMTKGNAKKNSRIKKRLSQIFN